MAIIFGDITAPEGYLWFRGFYEDSEWDAEEPWKPRYRFSGREFWPDGLLHREGVFQPEGMLAGTLCYRNGEAKFKGEYCDKRTEEELRRFGGMWSLAVPAFACRPLKVDRDYDGPPYPVDGIAFNDDDGFYTYPIFPGREAAASGSYGAANNSSCLAFYLD